MADPAAYAFVAQTKGVVEQHNLFRTGDGHIHALWFNFATGWHHEDRTAIVAGTPAAVGNPVPYAFVAETKNVVEQHNLFRTATATSTPCGSTSPRAGTTRTGRRWSPAPRRR